MPKPTRTDDLARQMISCKLCSDLPLGPRPLFQLGAGARLLIAGQAPGRLTHKAGVPFKDVSGDRLRDWLGLDAGQFYDPNRVAILPMGLCYPGTGRSGDLPPRPECAPAWREAALSRLPRLELTLIIGRYAIDWHLPHLARATVTHATQQWQDLLPDTLVLPHPSPRNNRWLTRNPWFARDVLPVLKARVAELMV